MAPEREKRRLAAIVILAFLVGATSCQPSNQNVGQPGASAPPKNALLPERIRRETEQAERLGRAIHQKDVLAAVATDALIRAHIIPDNAQPESRRIEGWLTLPDGADWVVHFGNSSAGTPRVLHSVRFTDGRVGTEAIRSHSAPRPFPGKGGAMFTAIRTTLAKVALLCEREVNTVVLPGRLIGRNGWLVYMLAATSEPELIIVGGHQRVHMSSAGDTVLEVKRFTKSCLRIPTRRPGEGELADVAVTHLLSDTPVETHVFLSLMEEKCCYVGTRFGIWQVSSGRIRFVRRLDN